MSNLDWNWMKKHSSIFAEWRRITEQRVASEQAYKDEYKEQLQSKAANRTGAI